MSEYYNIPLIYTFLVADKSFEYNTLSYINISYNRVFYNVNESRKYVYQAGFHKSIAHPKQRDVRSPDDSTLRYTDLK